MMESTRRRGEWAGWLVLVLLIIVFVPPFLRMGVWVDVTQYDVAARTILRGGVLYRDIFDTNLPGMVWAHAAIRSVFGWRMEVLRVADLLVVSACVVLLARTTNMGANRAAPVWTAVVISAFHLTQPEIIHIQRDIWMLPLALAALHLRQRHVDRIGEVDGPVFWRGCLEGLCWGGAVWIKPFVLVPALFCWIAGQALVWRRVVRGTGTIRNTAGLALGGCAAAVAGIAWLVLSGAWPHFLDIQMHWNPEYGAHAYGFKTRRHVIEDWVKLTLPWSYLVYAAVPLAVVSVGRAFAASRLAETAPSSVTAAGLYACFFLGWDAQAALLQPRVHPYVMAPVVFLAVPLVLNAWPVSRLPRLAAAAIAVWFVLAAANGNPALRRERLSLWTGCLRGAVTPAFRDQLTLFPGRAYGVVEWANLDRVASYLDAQHVADGDVLAFNDTTHPLYLLLDVKPPVRYMQFSIVEETFKSHRAQALAEIAASPARFVVGDLARLGVTASLDPLVLTAGDAARYPWNQTMVFRAGPYVVFQHPRIGDRASDLSALRFWR